MKFCRLVMLNDDLDYLMVDKLVWLTDDLLLMVKNDWRLRMVDNYH